MRKMLLMVAKQPLAGQVKTRLSSLFDAATAARFYHCLILDTMALMSRVPQVDRGIVFTPDEAWSYFHELAADDFDLHRQRGPDLGSRLLNVFRDYLARGYAQVVIMDSDSPTLPVAYLKQAFARLEEADVVLGPCEDGGYYLVGAKAVHPHLFVGVQMSAPTVLKETLQRAEAARLSVALLPFWFDVDVEDDVHRLRADLQQENGSARHTAEFFARIHRGETDRPQPRQTRPASSHRRG